MFLCRTLAAIVAVSACLGAEQAPPAQGAADAPYIIKAGTQVPLSLINTISTKNATPGDHVYLQTAFPVLDRGRIVIPAGSYVEGTVTRATRPGRMKGRGELYIRFDSLTLPNGVSRDFRGSLNNIDGMSRDDLNKKEGKVVSPSNKGGDAATVAEAGAAGASLGSLAGWGTGHPLAGMGAGAAAGAAAGIAAVLLTRGPDAILERGSTVELVLDRPLEFQPVELDFRNAPPQASVNNGPGPQAGPQRRTLPVWFQPN